MSRQLPDFVTGDVVASSVDDPVCVHCGGAHSDSAHTNPDHALLMADMYAWAGDKASCRRWIQVARKLVRENR